MLTAIYDKLLLNILLSLLDSKSLSLDEVSLRIAHIVRSSLSCIVYPLMVKHRLH